MLIEIPCRSSLGSYPMDIALVETVAMTAGNELPHHAPEPQHVRVLQLPWEGIESLKTILGIVDDHELKVDEQARSNLEAKLMAAPMQLGPIGAGTEDREVALDVSISEAALLLEALRFTDMMSVHLPFYEMVVEAIQFVGDRLTGLWSPSEWMTWRDSLP